MQMTNKKEFETIKSEIIGFIESELKPMEALKGYTPESRIPREELQQIWKRSRELGFYGIHLPENLGGMGLSVSELCELKMIVASSGSCLMGSVLGDWGGPLRVGSILEYATPHQLDTYFKPVIEGDRACCFAMTEPKAGSDPTKILTRAVDMDAGFKFQVQHLDI